METKPRYTYQVQKKVERGPIPQQREEYNKRLKTTVSSTERERDGGPKRRGTPKEIRKSSEIIKNPTKRSTD